MPRKSLRRERHDLTRRLRADGWTWVEIGADLRARWPDLTVLASLRVAHGWTQQRAADEWTQHWPDDPKTSKVIGLWENWRPTGTGRRPSLNTFDKLAHVYQCSVADLLAGVYDHRQLDSNTASSGATPLVASGATTVDDEPEGTDVERRDFILGIAATALATIGPQGAPSVARLSADVERAVRLEQRSQYAALGAVLPAIISDAKRLETDSTGDLQLRITRLLVVAQIIEAWVLIKQDQTLNAQATASQAVATAHSTDDVLLIGAALRCLSEAYMRGGTYDLATDLALEGAGLAGRRQPNSQAALVVQGAGLLSAATSCARAGDRSSAMKLLESADRRASDLGGDHVGSVVFGPTNVAIHRIAFEVELGDPAAALQHSTRFNIQDRPGLNERQARLLLDVARAQTELRQRSEALATMRHAESIAAEEVRTHRHSRAVLHDLQRSADAMPSTDLLQLAERCNALVDA